MATQLTVELPGDAFSILRTTPEEFGRELRLAAAVKWYEIGRLTRDQAAAIAGLSPEAFIHAVSEEISALQAPSEEREEDLYAALGSHG